MATKKKTAAKKPVKKAAKPAAKAAPRASRSGSTPKFVNSFVAFAKKNPAPALVGVIVVALFLMLIFS